MGGRGKIKLSFVSFYQETFYEHATPQQLDQVKQSFALDCLQWIVHDGLFVMDHLQWIICNGSFAMDRCDELFVMDRSRCFRLRLKDRSQ